MGLDAPRYLLDTNHWSYLERGHPLVVEHLKHAPAGAILYVRNCAG